MNQSEKMVIRAAKAHGMTQKAMTRGEALKVLKMVRTSTDKMYGQAEQIKKQLEPLVNAKIGEAHRLRFLFVRLQDALIEIEKTVAIVDRNVVNN